MLAERVKLGRAAAYAFVASEHDPGFLTRDWQPFFVGCVGSKTLVVRNIVAPILSSASPKRRLQAQRSTNKVVGSGDAALFEAEGFFDFFFVNAVV